MRITLVGTFGLRRRGTLAYRALPIGQALARRGHAVRLVLPPWDAPEDSGRRWSADGVAIEHAALPPLPSGPFQLVLAARLLGLALQGRPDVVHLFKPIGYSGLVLLALLARRAAGRPGPRIVLDADDWEGAGGWADRPGTPPTRRWVATGQERFGLSRADRLTVASRWLAERARQLGVAPSRVYYLPNGVAATPPSAAIPGPPTVLLFTRFVEFAPERAVELFARVRAVVPAARLLLVGEGLAGEEERFQAEVGRRGLGAAVEVAGFRSGADLAALLGRDAVAIYPLDDTPLNRAKCPAKLVQLQAAGRPVVADAVGEALSYVADGETGFLVPPGDDAAFARAVARLLVDGPLRARQGAAAARRARERFSWDRLCAGLEAFYRGE
jgi:glycosyltransferase involved in cell wall biosynthesis